MTLQTVTNAIFLEAFTFAVKSFLMGIFCAINVGLAYLIIWAFGAYMTGDFWKDTLILALLFTGYDAVRPYAKTVVEQVTHFGL